MFVIDVPTTPVGKTPARPTGIYFVGANRLGRFNERLDGLAKLRMPAQRRRPVKLVVAEAGPNPPNWAARVLQQSTATLCARRAVQPSLTPSLGGQELHIGTLVCRTGPPAAAGWQGRTAGVPACGSWL